MFRRCPGCRGWVGPIVLLTMTRRWTFACRRCWATVRATPLSAFVAGAAGAAISVLALIIWVATHGELPKRSGGLPFAVAAMTSRLFPRFVVEDPPLQKT
jgi:hypothetical protein